MKSAQRQQWQATGLYHMTWHLRWIRAAGKQDGKNSLLRLRYIYIYFADQVARKPPPAIVGSIFCNGEVTSNQMTWNPHSANNDKPQACTTWHGTCAETRLLQIYPWTDFSFSRWIPHAGASTGAVLMYSFTRCRRMAIKQSNSALSLPHLLVYHGCPGNLPDQNIPEGCRWMPRPMSVGKAV